MSLWKCPRFRVQPLHSPEIANGTSKEISLRWKVDFSWHYSIPRRCPPLNISFDSPQWSDNEIALRIVPLGFFFFLGRPKFSIEWTLLEREGKERRKILWGIHDDYKRFKASPPRVAKFADDANFNSSRTLSFSFPKTFLFVLEMRRIAMSACRTGEEDVRVATWDELASPFLFSVGVRPRSRSQVHRDVILN